jgi:sugar phosphate isomerase/epimerase
MDGKLDLDRRRFLGAAGGVAAAGALAAFPSLAAAHGGGGGDDDRHGGWQRWLPADHIGIQLFTVRDLLADNELDLPGTFEVLKDAGYAEVEIGGTYDGRTAAEFRALAEAAGLKPEGSHVPGGHDAWRTNLQGVLDDAEALGLRYVGIASPAQGTPATHDGYKALAAEFNAFGQAARDRGLKFYFHNHPTDFVLDGGTPIYDTLLANTDPSLVWFELDIAWIEAGGQSAVDYVKANGKRFKLFHVKDIRWADDGPRVTPPNVAQPNRKFWLVDVGKGDIDFARIFSKLEDPSRHHYFVEHDDAPDDETANDAAPRPRNPAGSANTAWTSRKYLGELQIGKRRRRKRH